jgi:hypothetical protein
MIPVNDVLSLLTITGGDRRIAAFNQNDAHDPAKGLVILCNQNIEHCVISCLVRVLIRLIFSFFSF